LDEKESKLNRLCGGKTEGLFDRGDFYHLPQETKRGSSQTYLEVWGKKEYGWKFLGERKRGGELKGARGASRVEIAEKGVARCVGVDAY